MKGLDTNVLLRYLAADDPEQTPIVVDLFATAERRNERLHVSTVVLCEVIWSLRSAYDMRRDGIVTVLENLLASSLFDLQDRELVRRALESYREGPADFSDYLLGLHDRKAGCSETFTFDRNLRGAAGFHYLGVKRDTA